MFDKKTLFLLLLVISSSTFATSEYIVSKIVGRAKFINSRKKELNLKEKMVLKGSGKMISSENSFVKLINIATGDTIVVGSNSQISIKKLKRLNIDSGWLRWFSGKTRLKKNSKGMRGVATKIAKFGIIGTDFFVHRETLLNEVEIIVFDGSVDFISKLSNERARISNCQWGGLGGRYDLKIGKILSLNKKICDQLKLNYDFPES